MNAFQFVRAAWHRYQLVLDTALELAGDERSPVYAHEVNEGVKQIRKDYGLTIEPDGWDAHASGGLMKFSSCDEPIHFYPPVAMSAMQWAEKQVDAIRRQSYRSEAPGEPETFNATIFDKLLKDWAASKPMGLTVRIKGETDGPWSLEIEKF